MSHLDHIEMRIRQRMPGVKVTLAFLRELWASGRVAGIEDFKVFNTTYRQRREYRVVTHEGQDYMLIRDAVDRNFVTILKP